jgi:hypothetical protein
MFEAAIGGVGHSRQRAAWTSLAAHAAMALAAIMMFAPASRPLSDLASRASTPILIWNPSAGLGGGGGSGGDRTREAAAPRAPNRTQSNGRPAATPPSVDPSAGADVAQTPMPIAAVPLASGADTFAGLMTAAEQGTTRGAGDGPGAGIKTGPGSGNRPGSGIGDGSDQGVGDGPYRPGNGVSSPRLVRDVKPNYTPGAMRARIQGLITVEVRRREGWHGQPCPRAEVARQGVRA